MLWRMLKKQVRSTVACASVANYTHNFESSDQSKYRCVLWRYINWSFSVFESIPNNLVLNLSLNFKIPTQEENTSTYVRAGGTLWVSNLLWRRWLWAILVPVFSAQRVRQFARGFCLGVRTWSMDGAELDEQRHGDNQADAHQ